MAEYGDDNCEICGGSGIIQTDDGAKPCRCRRDKILKDKQKRFDIPDQFHDASLSDYEDGDTNKSIAAAVERYTKKFDRVRLGKEEHIGFYLHGGKGTGKTHLGYAAVNELLMNDIPCFGISITDALQNLRPNNSEDHIKKMQKTLRETEFLLINDFGKQKKTEWANSTLWSLIDHRYKYQKPMFITSNEHPDQLECDIKGTIADRIHESLVVCEMRGDSKRR